MTNMYIDVEFRRETLYKHKLKDNNCLVFTHTHTHTTATTKETNLSIKKKANINLISVI